MLCQKASLRTIAKVLHLYHTTLSREVKRNTEYARLYINCKAKNYSYMRLHRQRSQARLKRPEVYRYVVSHLRLGWSPETIAGRLSIDHRGMSIHHESIYRYIYWDGGLGLKLWKYLTHARKRRMNRHVRRVKPCGKIPDAVSIDFRPQEVNEREISWHWETDNIIEKATDKTAVSTTVEQVTRYTILANIKKSAEEKHSALVVKLLHFTDCMKKTITTDNGAEKANHKDVTKTLSIRMYFCHAYHSWEKSSVENMNCRIRRYIFKGKSIDILSEEEVKAVEHKLNSTTRKCLGYLTPDEAMALESKRLARKRELWHEQTTQCMSTHPV